MRVYGDAIKLFNISDDDIYLLQDHSIRGMILDVDGTLYDQKAVRLKMAFRLLRYYFIHPPQWRSLFGIYLFRKNREKPGWKNFSLKAQIEIASEQAGLKYSTLCDAVQRWMFQEPLDLIKKYQYRRIIGLISQWKQSDRKIIIYSDYDPADKLNVLNIEANQTFYPDEKTLFELKPSRKSMQTIISKVNLPPEQLVYIGDRQEKDGVSAEMVGIRFIDVRQLI